jgi:hypothetical protein
MQNAKCKIKTQASLNTNAPADKIMQPFHSRRKTFAAPAYHCVTSVNKNSK